MQLKNWKRWSVALAMLGSLAPAAETMAMTRPRPSRRRRPSPIRSRPPRCCSSASMARPMTPGIAAWPTSRCRAWPADAVARLTGGVNGAPTQQPTLPAPGWATLLTGQWADEHGVRADTAGQVIKSATLFARLRRLLRAARRRSPDGRGGPVRRRRQGGQPAEPERLRRRRLSPRRRATASMKAMTWSWLSSAGRARGGRVRLRRRLRRRVAQDRRGRGGAAQADRRAPRAEPEGKLAAGRHQRLWPGRLAGRAPSTARRCRRTRPCRWR